MPCRQTEKSLDPPDTWKRKVTRILAFMAKVIEMTGEEHRIAEQVALFQYVDPKTDAHAAAQQATKYVTHRREAAAKADGRSISVKGVGHLLRPIASSADCNAPESPLLPVAPAAFALPLPNPAAEDLTSAISDEALLASMAGYIDDLAHSFRKSANLSLAEMEDWAQDLRVKCLSIPQDKRDQMTWCRVALKNYARDMYRKKVRRGKYMVNIEDDAEHVEASTAAESSAIAQTETTNDANKLLSLLNPLQQTIVREMLMSDSKPRPAEISKRLGITQDRLQAELAAAMEIMRSAAEGEQQ